ncbi:MAG TPA: nucleoside hydrolase, partial [Methylomirabilota bacterium]|nr:nucleoside hydrolase [Methylomirabilota bacterium]
MARPVLIDTDPGIDDALALFLAWGTPGVQVEAITTVAGNVSVDLATTNVFRLLEGARP